MIIERSIKQEVYLFATGKYTEGSSEPAGYDEIENLRVYLNDTDITDALSISEKLRIEEKLIESIRNKQE